MTADRIARERPHTAPGNETMPAAARPVDISVIIVNYNTRDVTTEAVASVLRHSGGLEIEVIVVDNDSQDGSVEALRAAFPQVTVVDTRHNGGYAWGNNVGLHRARGRYVLILNPDALLHETSLETALGYMVAHPEVGILGAEVFLEDGNRQLTVFRFPSLTNLFWRLIVPNRIIRESRWFGDQRYASRGYDRIMDVEVIAGCFMLLPRAVVNEVGLMDDRFFMYSEETEWCWRVGQAGYKVRYNPDVKITHFGAVSTGQSSPWKSVEIAKGHILFLRFTRGPLAAWAATALMLAGEVPRGFLLMPARLIGRKSQRAEIWQAKAGFLLRALFNLPRGQTPPPAEAAGQ